MDGKTFVLKASIDRSRKRVLLAECEKDFVDILFSFLTMPLGSIVSLIRSQHPNFELGCLSNLYNSVEKLDPGFVQNESFRANLLNPQNLAISQCKSLSIDGGGHTSNLVGSLNSNCTCDRRQSFAYPPGAPCFCGSWSRRMRSYKAQSVGGMFVKGEPRFVVSDELEVLPASTKACLSLLSRLGGIDGEKDDQDFTIGKNEVINLLMFSLVSKTALTETLLRTELSEGNFGVVSIGKLRVLGGLFEENQKIHIRLSNSKSAKKVFYAEANGDFINLLSSFLTIPLGQMVREIYHGDPSSVCITRLYKSVLNLDAAKYFISFEHREILLSPSLSFESTLISSYGTVCFSRSFSSSSTTMNTIPLALTTTQRIAEARSYGGFVKREAMFSVSGDLRIGPRSPVTYLSAISKLSADGLQDVETSDAYVGQKEAFRLLVASVFSLNALNEVFQVHPTAKSSDQPTTSMQIPQTKEAFRLSVAPVFSINALNEGFQVHPTAQRSDQPTTSMQIPQTKEALVFLPSGKHKRFKSLPLDWLLDILVILFFSWCLWILFNIR